MFPPPFSLTEPSALPTDCALQLHLSPLSPLLPAPSPVTHPPCPFTSPQAVRYSPSFLIYKAGRKVDEVVGKEPQKLEDHLWLHSDE